MITGLIRFPFRFDRTSFEAGTGALKERLRIPQRRHQSLTAVDVEPALTTRRPSAPAGVAGLAAFRSVRVAAAGRRRESAPEVSSADAGRRIVIRLTSADGRELSLASPRSDDDDQRASRRRGATRRPFSASLGKSRQRINFSHSSLIIHRVSA